MPKVHTVEEQERFIELRAKGKTLNEIGEELGISRQTLSKWCQEFECEIINGRALEIESLQSKYYVTHAQQIMEIGEQLLAVKEALKERDLAEDMSTKELVEYHLKLLNQLKTLERKTAIRIKVDSDEYLMKQVGEMYSTTSIDI